jgi:hypothetical protein
MNWRMDRSESVSEFKVTNCDLENKAADAQHKPPYEAQLGRGQAVPTQNQTNQALSAPPQNSNPTECNRVSISVQFQRACNLRGRARGLVGFDLCRYRLPPSQLRFQLWLCRFHLTA